MFKNKGFNYRLGLRPFIPLTFSIKRWPHGALNVVDLVLFRALTLIIKHWLVEKAIAADTLRGNRLTVKLT